MCTTGCLVRQSQSVSTLPTPPRKRVSVHGSSLALLPFSKEGEEQHKHQYSKAAQQYVVTPLKVDKDYLFRKNIVAGVITRGKSTSIRATLQELKTETLITQLTEEEQKEQKNNTK